jgi:tRNA A37 threonylcarbamoyltransferase TsaD
MPPSSGFARQKGKTKCRLDVVANYMPKGGVSFRHRIRYRMLKIAQSRGGKVGKPRVPKTIRYDNAMMMTMMMNEIITMSLIVDER